MLFPFFIDTLVLFSFTSLTGTLTTTLQVAIFPSILAVIVAVPGFIPFTIPFKTLTISSLLLFHSNS